MHLTRQKARELPCFIEAPDFDPAQGFLLTDSLQIPLHRDGNPVTSFVPGWSADGISLLFYPTIILQFRHVNGETAYWLLDATFTFVGSNVSELLAKPRKRIQQKVAMIATFLTGLAADTLPCRIPDDVQSFLRLAAGTRQEILAHSGHDQVAHEIDWAKYPQACETGTFFSEVKTNDSGAHCVVHDDRMYVLRMGGQPASLLPGWRIVRISSLFFPLFVADLQHEEGRAAYWFFDRHGNHRGDHWKLLSEPAAGVLAGHSAAIVEDLWQDVVASPGDRTRDHVEAFLALPTGIRHAIFDFLHSPPRSVSTTAIWSMDEPPTETMAYVAQTERGPALLNHAHLHENLLRQIHRQNVVLANEGVITWPSPIDGRELPTSGFALLLDNQGFAYRVQDLDVGLTFYIIAFEWHFRTFALYLPENDLLIARDPEGLAATLRYSANFRLHLLGHAIHFGDAILAGAAKPVGDLFHTFRGRSAIHIGHFIWQDLSGVHDFLAAVKPDRIPRFLVLENHLKPEIYGPIDTLFPSLGGKVLRLDDTFYEVTAGIYERNERVIKATGMYVRRSIGASILSGYKALPAYSDLVSSCNKARDGSDVVVLIGLRAGNRTIVDMKSFVLHLVTAIYEVFPNAAIIIDGQNASPGAIYESVGDDPAAPNSFLRQELEIAQMLSDYAFAKGYKLINNIGRPILESLLWCDVADFFVAPWGAALAKYRWVCNKPGLVITGRWNLEHRRDLSIYHSHNINEDPAEIWFNDPQTVEDVLDPEETDVHRLERGNFKVNAKAIQEQAIKLLIENFARQCSEPGRLVAPKISPVPGPSMDGLRILVFDPIVQRDGVLCLRVGDRPVPIRLGREPVKSFTSGWKPTFAYLGYSPLTILQFTHESGETGSWIIDDAGLRIGGSIGELSPEDRQTLLTIASPLVKRLVATVLELPTPLLDAQMRAFLLLPEPLRREIATFCSGSILSPPHRVILETDPDWEGGDLKTDLGLCRQHIEAMFAESFQDRLLTVTRDGMFGWPSPIDGRALRVQGSLCSDDFRFAYRLSDQANGLVFYLIVANHEAATLCLYVPVLGLAVFDNSHSERLFQVAFPDMAGWLTDLVCRFGAVLEGYLAKGCTRIASIMRGRPGTHIGHQLWNELSGVERFLASAQGPHLPEWIVPGKQVELWGPIDKLFPQLQERVDRSAPDSDAAIRSAYDRGTCLVRITHNYVSSALRDRLHQSVVAEPVYNQIGQIVRRTVQRCAPVILLGLRVENRTVAELVTFLVELLRLIAEEFPGAILVVDGHNVGAEGQTIESHGEHLAAESPMTVERQIVEHLQRLQVELGVTVLDAVGAPIRTSQAWCEHADCFFSIWGASLSKYRWACNKTGLVLTSRWNLINRADLHIYDSPAFMEMPSPMAFVDADTVQDLPDAPLLVDVGPGQPSFFNFSVDAKQVFRKLHLIIKEAMISDPRRSL
jgi:hypothetical protein